MIIPGDIAPHDGFKSCPGRIKQDVHATMSGLELASPMRASNTHDVSGSVPTSTPEGFDPITTQSRNTSSITSYSAGVDFERTVNSRTALGYVPKERTIQATNELPDTIQASRRVRVRYNPNRDGGFSKLEDISSAHVPGIGINELHMVSDVVSSRSHHHVCLQ